MRNCVIFGAGFYGRRAYFKLRNHCNILYYVDNNIKIQGSKINNIPVISFNEMLNFYNENDVVIIICYQRYQEMAAQLVEAGISDYYVMLEDFLYHYSEEDAMMPVELQRLSYYKKEDKDERTILFVQNTACIRTHKVAALMKKKGYKVFLLYTIAPPEYNNQSFEVIYEKIYTVYSPESLIDFVNGSDFDVIHSSNEPDILTNYLHLTNKKIVFDTHDTISIRGNTTRETLALEYIANKRSDGTIYTSERVREIAVKRYNIPREKTFVLENLISEEIHVEKRYEKLSSMDGKIHCVYEGGVAGYNTAHHRFFENIWKKITDCGIHIHFYSQSDYEYCKALDKKSEYLHFEGNMGSMELASEMTKYDCGLAIFNVTFFNKVFLETGTANKIYEYLRAGLPVIVGNINSYIDFVEKYKVGIHLDLEGDIRKQLQNACSIKIEDDFLEKNSLTMNAYADDLERFYQSIIEEV